MKYVCLAVFLIVAPVAMAQDWTFYGCMPTVSQSGSIGSKVQYNLVASSTIDAFHRTIETKDYPATALQYYIQPSLSYKVSPNVQVGAGYAYVMHNLFGLHVNENRLWAQVVASHDLPMPGRIRLSHRLRYEERYPFNRRTNQWSYATLLRYQVGISMPFYNPKLKSKGFYAAASNEFFFCLTGAQNGPISSKNAFYGEDWVYGGIGYNTGKFGKVELGYLYQDLIRNAQQDHRHLHLLQLTWAANFDLSEIGVWLYTPMPGQ